MVNQAHPAPADPAARQDDASHEIVRAAALFDAAANEAFDRLTRLAARVVGVPVALVSLAGQDPQFFKSGTGLPEPRNSTPETLLTHPFLRHTFESGEPLVVSDARRHPLFADDSAGVDLRVLAYIGVPLRTAEGHILGVLCVIDTAPRSWSDEDVATVHDLAAAALAEIELRATVTRLREREERVSHALEERERLLEGERESRLLAERMETVLATVIEHVPVGLFVTDSAGHVLFVNQIDREISGLTLDRDRTLFEQMAGYVFEDPESGEHIPIEQLATARALQGEHVHDLEIILHRPGQRARHLRLDTVPLQGNTEEVLGAVGVVTDVTESRETERQQLDFIYAAAHDLKNPVTSIKGFAQLLERRVLREGMLTAERSLPDIRRIDSTAGRMTALIGELLDTTRLQRGELLELQRERTDLTALIERVTAQARETTDAHQLVVSAGGDLVGNWDPFRLERVLSNLLTNAIKYSAGGEIAVTAQRAGDVVMVSISDQGMGIPEKDLPHIFDRFFRASNARRARGTGIGLSGARQIVEQHGGEISAESVLGEGTTFTVRLPAS